MGSNKLDRLLLPVTFFLLLVILISCTSDNQSSSSVDEKFPIRFSTVQFLGEAPSYVAYYNGYFQEEGLQVTLDDSPAGNVSLEKLFNGDTDIITIADTPLVYAAFERNDFVIFGSIVQSDSIAAAVARRDSGINSPEDIVGKRVALTQGTASDFFMAVYFSAYDINYSDVEIISMSPPDLIQAIQNGDIDVMFNWQPNIQNVMESLGDNAYRLPGDGMKPMEWLLVTRRDFAENNPEQLVKFLRAMERAENFIATDQGSAISLHAAEIGLEEAVLATLWQEIVWRLTLDEALLINLENQARWAVDNEKVGNDEIPNFYELIFFDALEAVNPNAITILR